MNKATYLDYAASTPMNKKVLLAMEPFFIDDFYNPSATYLASRDVKKAVQEARHSIAQIIGAQPGEIVFTAGGSEANNLAIKGIMNQYPKGNLVATVIEHDSLLEPASELPHKLASVDKNGIVDPADIEKLIDENTVMVSVILANNEVGTIQPVKEISQIVDRIKRERLKFDSKVPLYLHTDAAQATNYLDIHVNRLGVDLMTINGSKIYGPKQIGALYVKAGAKLSPQVSGGGQERGIRSGTENVPYIIGFAKAMTMTDSKKKSETKRLTQIRNQMTSDLLAGIKDSSLNGHKRHRLANNINIQIPGADGERLVMELDEAGVQCATGSACSALKDESSHVLKAMGLSEKEASSSLRLSLGRQTSADDVAAATKIIIKVANKHLG